MMNITKEVAHLIIANVLFFLLAQFIPMLQDKAALYYIENPNFHWWQVFSHLFMHASVAHIFFNMFALYSFGAPLESYFGSNRFIVFYFACGLGAAFLHTAVNYYEFHSALDILQSKGFSISQAQELLQKGMYNTGWEEALSKSDFKDMMSAYMIPAVGASGAVYGDIGSLWGSFPQCRTHAHVPPHPDQG